jgi:hypothetical protein
MCGLEVKPMMKFAGYFVLAIVLAYLGAVSQADVVGIVCTDLQNSPYDGDPLPADVWSFDYHTQTLTINEVVHDMCPRKLPLPMCVYDSTLRVWGWTAWYAEQATLTIIKNITNETGVAWTSYIQELLPLRSYCLFVEGSAGSEELPEITYKTQPPLPYTIEFAGPEPVVDGESVTIRFDVWCDASHPPGKFDFDVTPNPIPEPQTISLLALGALTLLRKQKRA